jgi:hypothetical protein
MYIKLEFKSETPKAFQLANDCWIPKSVLDCRGLEHPYYHIKDWWLTIQVENIALDVEELKYIRKKFDEKEKDVSLKTMQNFENMIIKFGDIPSEIKDKYNKYWKGLASDIDCHTPDYEPRMYGNDCFEGDSHLYGQN